MKLLYGSQFHSLVSQMPENTSTTSSVTVKLSGDGALFSRTAQFTLLSFSFPDLSTEMLSLVMVIFILNLYSNIMTTLCTGNYTFAAVKEGENFLVIKEAFAPVLEEIDNLIQPRKVSAFVKAAVNAAQEKIMNGYARDMIYMLIHTSHEHWLCGKHYYQLMM